jgi:hypothetical protein
MDFYQICTRESKGVPELYADFTVGRSKDLMVRGRSFYAIWDEKAGLWSTDEYKVQELVDEELREYAEKSGVSYNVKYLRSFSNNGWSQFRKYMQNISDNSHELDSKLTFSNTDVKKSDYVSRRLPYPLEEGDCSAWDELVGTLYSVEERAKIEWAIGAIVSGDSKKIQKFLVLYGPAGTGKSTILNIIQDLFTGYVTTFDAKALGSSGSSFATEVFKDNPLVAIQHDGDLSKIEDNTRLNSIISHEDMPMNEKYKPGYTAKVNAFLFMGTNQPVKISDAKSGIIRRLIDVHPTGVKIPANHYTTLMSRIQFEHGAIAHHCLQVYREMGKNFYNAYRPLEMMLQTDVFFNYIEACYDIFKSQDGVTLSHAYSLYKEFCGETGVERQLPQYKVREELRNYFDEFHDRFTVNGSQVRSYYKGFNANKFKTPTKEANTFSLVMEETVSLFDDEYADMPAQGATPMETPKQRWANVTTTLADMDPTELHFVKVPEYHIVIDFDLKDETGQKSLERNLAAASNWPATYGELSKSGAGVHLHYNYDGDVSLLRNEYSEGIEVKVYRGDSSLRRKLSKCNHVPIATINSGLPLKEKKMLQAQTIQSEKGIRELISRNLRKEIHPYTKSSVDFIEKILNEAYESGMSYDVSDLKPVILSFAARSSNQAMPSIKTVQRMKFVGQGEIQSVNPVDEEPQQGLAFGASAATQVAAQKAETSDSRLVFWDVEVYPNLFVICWKYQGSSNVVRMINPSPQDVEALLKLKLVGFNNRRYDNHMLYARYMGASNKELYNLSQRLINNDRNATFGEAYNISYADIWDFSSVKKSLKWFMIKLGFHKMEMDIPWDQEVPEDMVQKVVDYCVNDVLGTEAVFEDRKGDFIARQILAELSGLTVNDTTARHTAKIIFGNDRSPQRSFKYTDLSVEFPGYTYDPFRKPQSLYKGQEPSEGGYVYAKPGMYENVAVMDVASMHPTSIIRLNLFGDEYTPKFADIYNARLAIKRGDFNAARTMLDGRLKPYLEDESHAKDLAYALKIVINIVYGLTSAKFENPFRDPRNKDNIVAKRGALFMIELKDYVENELGAEVVHIKTDSIKIPNATAEVLEGIEKFGEKYGYEFEHETTYDKFCLVNDAVYIARKPGKPGPVHEVLEGSDLHTVALANGEWEAVGAQFQHPYVFKTLFTNEELTWDDFAETKQVQKGSIYIDFDAVQKPMHAAAPGLEGLQFIGRIGRFVPVTPESGGGVLYRVDGDKKSAVAGTKGYVWLDAEVAKNKDDVEIDMSYFDNLATQAVKAINNFGDFEQFLK